MVTSEYGPILDSNQSHSINSDGTDFVGKCIFFNEFFVHNIVLIIILKDLVLEIVLSLSYTFRAIKTLCFTVDE